MTGASARADVTVKVAMWAKSQRMYGFDYANCWKEATLQLLGMRTALKMSSPPRDTSALPSQHVV